MGGVANLALQALPVIANAQKTVSGFQTANDSRYAAQLDAQQKADALAFEKQKTADALALEREKIAASQKEAADQKEHAEQVLRETQTLQRRQLLQDQATADQAQQADVATRRAQIENSAASDEAARLKALRRTVGRTRASLGAGGGGTSDGSGEAVLLGMVADTNQNQQEADAIDRLRTQALSQEVADTQKSNLLERSQLAEKQRLELFSNAY
jgi:colicin import membrane protein